MNIRKVIPIIVLIVALGALLTACMSDGTLGIQTTPSATADYYPGTNDGANGNNAAGNRNATDGAAGLDNNAGNNTGNNAAGTMDNTGANGATGTTGNTSSTTNGALNGFDWANNAADIERAIGQISEISESRVVVTNSTALVGVKFDSVYKGELTERIREMVASEVMKADPSIQTVAVTSDDGDVQKVYALSDQIRSGRTADELSSDINAIVRNATTMR